MMGLGQNTRRILALGLIAIGFLIYILDRVTEDDAESPRLTVFIVVDQLSADLIAREAGSFPPGGFARLMRDGAWFPRVRIDHAHTETAVGHASLVTGVHPSSHGIIANSWYAQAEGKTVKTFAAEDRLICGPEKPGFSPTHLKAKTIGDALREATGGNAKVFSVTGKDRSAVALGGARGTAFWYQPSAKGFASSAYYLDACPAWVEAWHKRDTPIPTVDRYLDHAWTLSQPPTTENYKFSGDNTYPTGTTIEANMVALENSGFGRSFPHQLNNRKLFHDLLTATPFLDALTADFALDLVDNEGLGKDDVPDLLLVGFSANDYVLHNFGPSTRESEEILYRLDRTLADFLGKLEERVGADNLLIVLTSDHGGPEYPWVYRDRDGLDAGWIPENALINAAREALDREGLPENLIEKLGMPYIHVNLERIADEGLDLGTVLDVIARAVESVEGVHAVIPTTTRDTDTSDEITRRVFNKQFSERSGQLYIIRKRYWQKRDPKGPFVLLQHGSVWNYDSTVPLGFLGPDIEAAIHDDDGPRNVDIYPTLARILGLPPDPTRAGNVLEDVFSDTP